MAGVVHPRRQLVGEQRVVGLEQLDAADADEVERSSTAVAWRSAAACSAGVQPGAGARDAQDPVAVLVLDDRPARDRAVVAAHRHDRELAPERDERLEDERHAAEGRPGRVDVGGGAQHVLALAVVAAPAGLEHRRQTELATAASRSSRPSTVANAAVGICSDRNSDFSSSRSCDTSRARMPGATRCVSARWRAEPAGTPSHS